MELGGTFWDGLLQPPYSSGDTQVYFQAASEDLQGGRLHLSRQPGPALHHPQTQVFPDIKGVLPDTCTKPMIYSYTPFTSSLRFLYQLISLSVLNQGRPYSSTSIIFME